MRNESAVKAKITKELRRRGAWYTMPHQRGYSHAGVPDIIGWFLGTPFAIECKYNGNQPSKDQEKQLRLCEDAGAIALVIDETNISLVWRWLDALENYYEREEQDFAAEIVH